MKRFLAMLLCVVMVFSLLPTWAFASEEEEITQGEYADFEDDDLMDEYYEALGELEDLEAPEEPDELEEPANEEEEPEDVPETEEEPAAEPDEEEENTEVTDPAGPVEEPEDGSTHSKEQEEPAEEGKAEPTEEPETEETVSDDEEEKEVTAQATSGTCGDNLTWTLDDEGTLTISGTGEMLSYADSAKPVPWSDTKVSAVVIQDGVTSIGWRAFYGQDLLSSVIIPSSVTFIDEDAFCNCTCLRSMEILGENVFVYTHAFVGCPLKKIRIPNSIHFENQWLSNCKIETAGSIGSGCDYEFGWTDSIPDYAFAGCSDLTSITIPDTVTSIGKGAFSGCFNGYRREIELRIPASVTSIGEGAFSTCGWLTEIVIPDGVTRIEKSTFAGCVSLTRIEIPQSVTSIGAYAFEDCENLAFPDISGNVTYIGEGAFYGCHGLTDTIHVPSGLTCINSVTFDDCINLKKIIIPSSVTAIEYHAFSYCNNLKTIIFEHSTEDEIIINKGGFYNTDCIKTVIGVPDPDNINSAIANYDWDADNRNVNYIKYETTDFSGVLKEGDGWKLNWKCFGDDPADLTLEISLTGSDPSGRVIILGDSPWLDKAYGIQRENITKILILGTNINQLEIQGRLFQGYTSLKSLTLSRVCRIFTAAFQGCTNLTKVNGFDEYLLVIYDEVFKDCINLKSTVKDVFEETIMPKCLAVIGQEAFMNTSLETIYLLDEVESIGENAFSGCEDTLTIYCYPHTFATSYAVNNRLKYQLLTDPEPTSFEMGRDNWRFGNGEPAWEFKKSLEIGGYYLTNADKERLLLGSDNVQRKIIDYWQDPKKRGLAIGGFCRGLAATTVLVKMGLLMPSDFQNGAETLYSIKKPFSEDMESLVNYYFLTQHLYNNIIDKVEFRRLSTQEQLQRIEILAESANAGGPPFLLEAEAGSGLHAVVCYGVKQGTFLKRGTVYDRKLLINDSNKPEDTTYLYYKHNGSEYYWPAWPASKILYKATNDPTILAPSPRGETLKFYTVYSDRLSSYDYETDGTHYLITPDINTGEIIGIKEADGYGNQSGSVITIPIKGSDYVITPPASDCDFMIALEDALIDADCESASQLAFHPNGDFIVSDINGNYDLTLLFNEGHYSTPWYETNIQGTGNGADISMSQAENGVLIEGADNGMINVTLTDINGNEERLYFETDNESVLISTAVIDGQEKSVVLADEDGNGSYETVISTQSDEPEEPEITVPLPTKMTMNREYLLMNPGTVLEAPLQVQNVDDEWLDFVKWSSEDESIATVDQQGYVTAQNPGTVDIKATISAGGKEFVARCRVDVLDEALQSANEYNVDLPVQKVTTELFSRNYATVPVVIGLAQNMVTAADVETADGTVLEDTGVMITGAEFENSDIGKVFGLRIKDDRNLEIIPVVDFEKPAELKAVKGSYKSKIHLTLADGAELTTPELTLTVKKSFPKLKAEAVKLNRFIKGDRAKVVITGGTVKSFTANTLPIATLSDDLVVTVNNNRNGSGRFTLKCELEDWVLPATVAVPVTVGYTAPKVTLKPASLTLNPSVADTAAASVTVTPLPGMNHVISVNTGTTGLAYGYNSDAGVLTVSAGSAESGTYKLPVLADGKQVTTVTVKVLSGAPAVTLTAKAMGAIDTAVPNSPVTITVTGKNYNASAGYYNVQITQEKKGDAPVVVLDESTGVDAGLFTVSHDANVLTLTGTDALKNAVTGYTYTVTVSSDYGTAKPVKLSVKTSAKAPVATATLKASGSIDVLRPGTSVTVTPTFKNWYGYDLSTAELVLEKELFNWVFADGVFVVTAKNGANINAKAVHTVSMTLDGRTSAAVKLPVKMGTAKVMQDVKAITLSRNDRYNRQSVVLSLADQTLYDIGDADVVLVDKSGNFELTNLGNGEYAIGYKNSLLPKNVNALKTASVQLLVYLKGNGTHTFNQKENGTKNASIPVKISVAGSYVEPKTD